MPTILKIARAALLLAQFLILTGWAWLFFESREVPKAGLRSESRTVIFEVEKHKGVRAIAEELKDKRLIRKKWPLILLYKFFYSPQSIKAGEYQLPSAGTSREILETLIRGKIFLHPVTVAEGLTAREVVDVFLAAGFGQKEEFIVAFSDPTEILLWDPKAQNLEGYLYPETYLLPKGISAREIFQKMTAQFKVVFGEPWRRQAVDMGLTIREIVTLASLIEKETSRPEEKKLVAAVFHNRLRLGMKLDCDPTIIYTLKQNGAFEGRLRTKDLKFDSSYNTYLYPGLPPGPISNPGRKSLEAALYPSGEDYLYFVSKNDGSHHFSRTFREHQLAVKKYQR
jgi:UPF0755 protein